MEVGTHCMAFECVVREGATVKGENGGIPSGTKCAMDYFEFDDYRNIMPTS